MKFVEVDKLGTGFRLGQKPLFSDKKSKLKKIIFEFEVIMMSKPPFGTQPWVVINCAKFGHRRSNSFGGVKTQTHTHRI